MQLEHTFSSFLFCILMSGEASGSLASRALNNYIISIRMTFDSILLSKMIKFMLLYGLFIHIFQAESVMNHVA